MAVMYTALAGVLFDSVMRLDMSRNQLGLLERKFEAVEATFGELQKRLNDAEAE